MFHTDVLRLGCDWLSLPVVSFHFDICLLQSCCPLRLLQPPSFFFLYGITFVSPPPQVGCGKVTPLTASLKSFFPTCPSDFIALEDRYLSKGLTEEPLDNTFTYPRETFGET